MSAPIDYDMFNQNGWGRAPPPPTPPIFPALIGPDALRAPRAREVLDLVVHRR